MPARIPNIASSCAIASLRVLVVGADGFVGRAVSSALARRGHRVVAAVRGRVGGRARAPRQPISCRCWPAATSPQGRRDAAWWFALGWPAFAAVLAIFYLMVVKPDL